MKSSSLKRLVAVLSSLAVLTPGLQAGGLRTVRIPDLPFTSRPIVIDGELGEWSGVEGVTYQPFDVSLAGSQNPAVRTLQEKPSVAKVLFAYDTEAMYCAVDWKGSHPAANTAQATSDGAAAWWKKGDGIELHLSTDQTVHLASWPLADGGVATMERLNDQTAWTAARAAGITSAIKTKADHTGYTEEIRIPWSALSKAGGIPKTGKFHLACDVVWKDIDAKLIEQLPAEVHANSHLTYNFFTSPAALYTRTAVFNPNTWGELTFGTEPQPPRIESSPLGTGVTAWTIPASAAKPTMSGGSLFGWSAPFADLAIEPALTGSRYGGKISLQYDADNLYVAAHLVTSGPQQNMMTETTQQGYIGGDALQIRIHNKKSVNLCGWYDSATRKPALTADGVDLANAFLLQNGAQETFATDADGLGYSQLISVPWKVLFPGEAAPRSGDKWRLTFQPWWSGMDPRCTFLGTATLGKIGAFDVTYQLPADGEVSLGLFDQQNHLLRNILKSDFRNKGTITDHWDGLDQWGQPVPPGSYVAKGIYHPPITTEHVMSYGNPGNPPWPTADNKGDWLSDEAAPQAAATDGQWVFLAAPGNEKGYALMAVDGTGQKQWGVQEGFNPCTVSLAVDGDHVYALYSGPEQTDPHAHLYTRGTRAIGRAILQSFEKRTGAPSQFSQRAPRLKVASWPYVDNIVGLWDLRNSKGFSPDVYTGQIRYFTDDLGEATSAIGLAATNGLIYVALHDENKILVLKADTAEKVDEIPVPKPAGLYALPDHTLLAVSDKTVVRIDPQSKQVQGIINSGLLAPRCVTADRKGRMYVSDWGASFQVKIFGPTGALLGSVGKQGGRPWLGKWEASAMVLPTGIAVTDQDQLWVAEDDTSPPRISVWNPENGALIKDYLGPTAYGGGGSMIDPADPSTAYALGVRLKMDYAAKTWKPEATVERRMDLLQPFARNGYSSSSGRIVHHGGHEYMIFNETDRILVAMRKGDIFVTVAAMGGLERGRTTDGSQWTFWDSDLGSRREPYFPPFFKGHAGDNYTWVDTNGDGLVQENEIRWYKTAGRGDLLNGGQPEACTGWGFSLNDNWTIFWAGFCKDAGAVYRLDLKGWTPEGAPIYDINDSKPIVLRDASWNPESVFGGSDGNVIVSYGYEYSPPKNTLECFDGQGKPLWALAHVKEQGLKDVECDSVLKEFKAPGIGNVYAGWLWHGNYLPYLFTSDGLYVSSLLQIGRLGPNAGWDESYKTYYQDPNGVPYVVNGANDTFNLLKINGLEGGRFEAPVTITKVDMDRAATLRELPAEKPVPAPVIQLAWSGEPPKIDGNLDDWDLSAGVTLKGDKGRTAQIALARDASNLYLAYQVSKESPLVNKGTDSQTLFISGDCVDLMLGTDAKANPHRQGAIPGDERLLISLYQGKPIAVLYRPVVPGAKNPSRLMAAQIDQIIPLPSAKIAYQTKGNTYSFEASVPLQDLGIDPKEHGALRGDVGVIFADETGSSRSQRLYYYNKKTSMTADLTTEATLQPGEWGEIQFPLGKNLLLNGGFEEGFASGPASGWFPRNEKNGARAVIDADAPHSGHQSLLLEQIDPVVFPSEAFGSANYDSFIRSANQGAGGGNAEVEESVPVVGGHYYSFRCRYRTQDMRSEKKEPGPQRGYTRFGISLNWMNDAPNKARVGGIQVIDERRDVAEWKESTNSIVNYWAVNKPFQAPAGASSVVVGLYLNTLAANDLPKVYVDDLELVEVPPGTPAQ